MTRGDADACVVQCARTVSTAECRHLGLRSAAPRVNTYTCRTPAVSLEEVLTGGGVGTSCAHAPRPVPLVSISVSPRSTTFLPCPHLPCLHVSPADLSVSPHLPIHIFSSFLPFLSHTPYLSPVLSRGPSVQHHRSGSLPSSLLFSPSLSLGSYPTYTPPVSRCCTMSRYRSVAWPASPQQQQRRTRHVV